MQTPEIHNDYCAGSAPAPASRTLEVDIVSAARIGTDGVSITFASVDERGELLLALSNGTVLNAGRVTGSPGLAGIAHPDTIPAPSADPQLYIALDQGTYGHFADRQNRPVKIDRENTVVFLFRAAGATNWDRSEMALGSTGSGQSFAGKRIVLYGDMIVTEAQVAPGTCAGLIRQKFGTDRVTVSGFDGCLAGVLADRSDSLAADGRIDTILALEPDLLILLGGTKDYWTGMPLGELYGDLGDAAYLRTVTGGLRHLLRRLRDELPAGVRMLFCTPAPSAAFGMTDLDLNVDRRRMSDCVQRLKAVCADYHVPVCDAWANADWSNERESRQPRFTTDGIHLSAEGYGRLADLLLVEARRSC
jgi:lysophospholipase L1-like esterase